MSRSVGPSTSAVSRSSWRGRVGSTSSRSTGSGARATASRLRPRRRGGPDALSPYLAYARCRRDVIFPTYSSSTDGSCDARDDGAVREPPHERRRSSLRALLELAPERALGRVGHALMKNGDEGLGGQRAQAVQRLADLRPVGVALAGLDERLPDGVHEQAHERPGDRVGVAAGVIDDVQRGLERDAEGEQRLAGAQQRRAGDLEAAVAEGQDEPELL